MDNCLLTHILRFEEDALLFKNTAIYYIVTMLLFWTSILVCHLWVLMSVVFSSLLCHWTPYTLFLHLSHSCQHGTHYLLFVILFHHTWMLHAAFKWRLTELTNFTHFYSNVVYSQNFMQDLGQPRSSQPPERGRLQCSSKELHVQCFHLPLLTLQY
jgi:hypothetical protein